MKKNIRKTRSSKPKAELVASKPEPAPIASPAIAVPEPKHAERRLSWRALFIQTLLAAYAYAFMEWVFYATKSSFMDAIPFGKKLELFLLTGLIIAALGLAPVALLRILGLIPGPTRRWQVFQILAALVPALVLAAMSLLLIDNFTYTVFNFGIVTSQGALRAGYAVLAAILWILWFRQMLISANIRTPVHAKPQPAAFRLRRPELSAANFGLGIGAALAVLSFAVGLIRLFTSSEIAGEKAAAAQRQPHVILLAGEGLDDKWMSLYGYPRDTTPNLRQLAATGLLAENNFTNAAHTTGSEFSLLTGKYPAETRLLYSPNILQGHDAYPAPAGHPAAGRVHHRADRLPLLHRRLRRQHAGCFRRGERPLARRGRHFPPRPEDPLGGCRVFPAAAFGADLRPAAAHFLHPADARPVPRSDPGGQSEPDCQNYGSGADGAG